MKAIKNGNIVTENEIIENGTILIVKGRIRAVGKGQKITIPEDYEIVDAEGMFVGPGFVDNHCHGGDAYTAQDHPGKAALHHLRYGTTSLSLALGYSLSYEDTVRGIEAIKHAMAEDQPGNLKGIFFEGPFNNPNFGANSEFGRSVNKEEYESLYEMAGGAIRQWMYAPELEKGDDFARFVVSKGIPLAIGHTAASPDTVARAAEMGATICTHLFDAMGCHLGNDSIKTTGIIQDTAADAALITEQLYLEIICDSRAVHVKPANLKLAYKCGGPDRVCLITDSTIRPNHDPSQYAMDDVRSAVDINFNEKGQLSGSRLTMNRALKNMYHYTGAPIIDLFRMASSTPAKAVNLFDDVGSIEVEKSADLVFVDHDLNLRKVFLRGELVSEL